MNALLSENPIYNWNGLNAELFLKINHLDFGLWYDRLMRLGSFFGDIKLFPVYFLIFVLFIYSRKQNSFKNSLKQSAAVFVFAGLLMFVSVFLLKHFFKAPRPFAALPEGTVRTLGHVMKVENPYLSFPSGHSAMAVLMAASLWPVLGLKGRFCAVLFVVCVLWSRMAVGAHFPSDVLAGGFIGLFFVLMIRPIVKRFLWKQSKG